MLSLRYTVSVTVSAQFIIVVHVKTQETEEEYNSVCITCIHQNTHEVKSNLYLTVDEGSRQGGWLAGSWYRSYQGVVYYRISHLLYWP